MAVSKILGVDHRSCRCRRDHYLCAMRILMVCLGNICRSPLAEGILQHKAAKAGLDWTIDSAGTGGYHVGEQPHTLSMKVAKMNGIDISGQRCRQFTRQDIAAYDRIFVMDHDNYHEVKRISGKDWDPGKVDYLLNALYPGADREVPDPWYGTEKDYHYVFGLVSDACERIVEQYKAL